MRSGPRLGEEGPQPPLGCALSGVLENCIDMIIRARGYLFAMRNHGILPLWSDLLLVLAQQCCFPDETNDEKLLERGVRPADELRLPEAVARELPPAAKADQQSVEAALQRRLGQAERLDGVDQGGVGAFGCVRDGVGEPDKADDFGGQVMQGGGAPRGIGAAPLGRGPECLALIEIVCRPVADPLIDHGRPVDAAGLACQHGDGRQRLSLGRLGLHRLFQRGNRFWAQRCRRRLKRFGQVVVGQFVALVALPIPVARHGQPDAGDPPQPCSGDSQRFPRLAQERIDSDARGQRPKRRNGARRAMCGSHDRFLAGKWGLGCSH